MTDPSQLKQPRPVSINSQFGFYGTEPIFQDPALKKSSHMEAYTKTLHAWQISDAKHLCQLRVLQPVTTFNPYYYDPSQSVQHIKRRFARVISKQMEQINV